MDVPGTRNRDTEEVKAPLSSRRLCLAAAFTATALSARAKPVGRFRLTLDKGEARNAISLCAEGVVKTGPTTFVVEKSGFSPARDLDILIVVPLPE